MWGLIFLPTLDFSMQGKVPFSERVTNHTIIDGICKGLEIYLNPASYFRKVVGGGHWHGPPLGLGGGRGERREDSSE